MSPIVGLTDAEAPLPPELGQLRKGGAMTRGATAKQNRHGEDLGERFRFTSEDPAMVKLFVATYGSDTPTELRVLLAGDTVDEALDAWHEAYVGDGMLHRCDGQRLVREYNRETGKWQRWPLGHGPPCPFLDDPDNPDRCRPKARLKVVLPELHRFGYVSVLTEAINDIKAIAELLDWTQRKLGSLDGIPWVLKRVEREIAVRYATKGEAPKRHRSKRWLIDLQPRPLFVDHALQAAQARALAVLPPPPDLEEFETPALPAPAPARVDAAADSVGIPADVAPSATPPITVPPAARTSPIPPRGAPVAPTGNGLTAEQWRERFEGLEAEASQVAAELGLFLVPPEPLPPGAMPAAITAACRALVDEIVSSLETDARQIASHDATWQPRLERPRDGATWREWGDYRKALATAIATKRGVRLTAYGEAVAAATTRGRAGAAR